jgi:hypothetical protein
VIGLEERQDSEQRKRHNVSRTVSAAECSDVPEPPKMPGNMGAELAARRHAEPMICVLLGAWLRSRRRPHLPVADVASSHTYARTSMLPTAIAIAQFS